MRFDILTIFPGFFDSPLSFGVLKRAIVSGQVSVAAHDLRSFTKDKHRTVDDRPFGGGEGMVLKPEPIFDCLEFLRVAPRQERVWHGSRTRVPGARESVVLLSPQGELFNQRIAAQMSELDRVFLICG